MCLQALYEAAGRPVYSSLLKVDGVEIQMSTLSDWIRGNSAPDLRNVASFRALIRHLNKLAGDRTPEYAQLAQGGWDVLLKRAADEGNEVRGGRPTAPRSPGERTARARQAPDASLIRQSAWIKQHVRPAQLLDRHAELEELKSFCTASDTDSLQPYTWWQAEPWAGKSALMAEFVSRPWPRLEVVSYFIGDRFGNNNRELFLQQVSQQLASIATRDTSTTSSRPEALPELCEAAAAACLSRGHRLVLVVDGLDEDSGGSPGAHSIAALLPRHAPPGMRVVVTGRPNPPVPDDVPDDHPLRNPEIIRRLTPFPGRLAISDLAGRELRKLLNDTPIGNGLLGLLTAARGALTGQDLATLLSVQPHEVSDRLRGVTGRSFVTTAGGQFRTPDEGRAPTYVLGHQELRRTALEGLGPAAVSEFEARLHAWADSYQEQGWPMSTPAYLLYEYPHLLRASSSRRLASFVLDPRRQLALLARSSVDTALAEVEVARQVVEREVPSDLATMAALAASQDMLHMDARKLPVRVSEAYARLGDIERALGLACSNPSPAGKATRLAKVARVLTEASDVRAAHTALEAARWAEQARREAAPPSGDEGDAEEAAGAAAVALMSVGQEPEGLALLRSLSPPSGTDESLQCECTVEASVVVRPWNVALADELLQQAMRYADAIASGSPTDPTAPVEAWAAILKVASPRQSKLLQRRISKYAAKFSTGDDACAVHAAAALALVADRPDEAAALAQQAASQLRTGLTAPEFGFLLSFQLTSVVRALLATGSADQATELVDAVPEGLTKGWLGGDVRDGAHAALAAAAGAVSHGVTTTPDALVQRACRLAEQGKAREATVVLNEAMAKLASSAGLSAWQEARLIPLCSALAAIGHSEDGELLARSLADPFQQLRALTCIAAASAAAGRFDPARRLASEVADRVTADPPGTARQSPDLRTKGPAMALAAQALAHAGEHQAALALAAETLEPKSGSLYVGIAAALRAHHPAIAIQIIDQARRAALTGAVSRGSSIVKLANLIAAIGADAPACTAELKAALERKWAEERAAGKRLGREEVLVAALLGSPEQREEAQAAVQRMTNFGGYSPPWDVPIAGFAIAQAAFGLYEAALRTARSHNVPEEQAEALVAVAAYLSGTPAEMPSLSDATDAEFVHTVRSLALLEMPPNVEEAAGTVRLMLAEGLTAHAWGHALPVLAHIAPEAVERVRDIVFGHRGLEASRPSTVP